MPRCISVCVLAHYQLWLLKSVDHQIHYLGISLGIWYLILIHKICTKDIGEIWICNINIWICSILYNESGWREVPRTNLFLCIYIWCTIILGYVAIIIAKLCENFHYIYLSSSCLVGFDFRLNDDAKYFNFQRLMLCFSFYWKSNSWIQLHFFITINILG